MGCSTREGNRPEGGIFVRIAVTGTPGTGKTTVTEELETDLSVIHLNDVIQAEKLTQGYDEKRESALADINAIAEYLEGRENVIFESHLAHQFDSDQVIVLRCHPTELESRLTKRGEPAAKARENAESEALDVILAEAVTRHGEDHVYEIDTTDRSIDAVVDDVRAVLDGVREPAAGTVSFIDYLEER